MGRNTKISWAEDTLNPIVGCMKVSDGCKHCYAEEMNKRFHWVKDWNKPEFFPERLEQLTPKQKPRRIFLCSLSDMFHEDVKWSWNDKIFDKITECSQHTFLILTKRPIEMKMFVENYYFERSMQYLPNVWLGVTCENQETANERIPVLLSIPAAKRFISVEPMLSSINLTIKYNNAGSIHNMNCLKGYGGWGDYDREKYKIDWVIIGCESGQNRRNCNDDWVAYLIEQSEDANVPVFLKQLVQNGKLVKEPYFNGKQYTQYPESEV